MQSQVALIFLHYDSEFPGGGQQGSGLWSIGGGSRGARGHAPHFLSGGALIYAFYFYNIASA